VHTRLLFPGITCDRWMNKSTRSVVYDSAS
jgi:hypothetical protein